jgi:hypothetical protein
MLVSINPAVKGVGPWVAYIEAGFTRSTLGRRYRRYPFRWLAVLDTWSYLHMNFFSGHIAAKVVGRRGRDWSPQSERTGA